MNRAKCDGKRQAGTGIADDFSYRAGNCREIALRQSCFPAVPWETGINGGKDMDVQEYIRNYLCETEQIARQIPQREIAGAVDILKKVKAQNGRLFILGVGGSAANASHAVNDFRKIGGIETYAPTDNVSELTARTNDEGWDTTFSEWLRVSGLGGKDCVMVLSVGGGNGITSRNIVNALKLAGEKGASVISIVSRDGGYSRQVSDACILVPVLDEKRITPHAEGWQGILWHLMVNAMLE